MPGLKLVAVGVLLAACTSAPTSFSTSPSTSATSTTGAAVAPDLAACPNPLVIQTDWFPEPEHGAVYQLTGGEGSIDPETGRFSGPLAADPSVTVEIRAGGPYTGFQRTATVMYSDDSVFLGFVNTDGQVATFESSPMLAVAAPLEKSPQILMFDPATYDFTSVSDIGRSDAVVNVFEGQFYVDWLVATGQLRADQIDPSYDGSPGRFIAEGGALVQQGFATQEPWNYEHVFGQWGRPVDYLLIQDAGYETYAQTLAIRPDKLDDAARACLTAFVPLVQQAAVDFMADPGPVNEAILRAVSELDSFWELSPEGVENTVRLLDELGIVANGPDETIGNFDRDRVARIIDQVHQIPDFADVDIDPEDIVTNDFIDPSIGLP